MEKWDEESSPCWDRGENRDQLLRHISLQGEDFRTLSRKEQGIVWSTLGGKEYGKGLVGSGEKKHLNIVDEPHAKGKARQEKQKKQEKLSCRRKVSWDSTSLAASIRGPTALFLGKKRSPEGRKGAAEKRRAASSDRKGGPQPTMENRKRLGY